VSGSHIRRSGALEEAVADIIEIVLTGRLIKT
jgi:hypothetical protein